MEIKQSQEFFYVVWNVDKGTIEHSNGTSGKYANAYRTIGPAKSLRTRRDNYFKILGGQSTKGYREAEERFKLARKKLQDKPGTKDWSHAYKKLWDKLDKEKEEALKDLDPNDYWNRNFVVVAFNLETGERKIVVDEKGKVV